MIYKAIFCFIETGCVYLSVRGCSSKCKQQSEFSNLTFCQVFSGISDSPTTKQDTTCNSQLTRNVIMLCQMFILPGSEISQHNLAQNFAPMALLLLVFSHSVWEKLWLLIASSHLRIEKGEEKASFSSIWEEKKVLWDEGRCCHRQLPSPLKSYPVCPQEVSVTSECSWEVLGDEKLLWAPSTFAWWSFLGLESHCTRMILGKHGSMPPTRWLWAKLAWEVTPAWLLLLVQEGQHPLTCEYMPTALHRLQRNHSPRSPWQMSVLVAPPRINLGSLTMSWKSGSET